MIMLSLWGTWSYADTTKDGHTKTDREVSAMVGPSFPETAREADQKLLSSASVGVGGAAVLQTIPTISTQVLVGGLTLLPYVAAGYGGGYVTERDRVLHSLPPAVSLPSSATIGLRSLVGPHLIPNELHLGVRVPF